MVRDRHLAWRNGNGWIGPDPGAFIEEIGVKQIRKFATAALLVSLASLTWQAPSPALAAENQPNRDPREIAPIGLIGYWKADIAASTFPGTKPLSQIRSFAFTADGKVLVSFATRAADGKITFGHWAAQVDGTPALEYHSLGNSLPWNVVSWKVVGEGRLALTVSRLGRATIEATYQLSDDQQTLTYSYGETVVIYRRWNLTG